MARKPLRPLIRSGGFYPSRKWTPLVYAGGYTTANGGGEPEPPPIEKTIIGNPIHILDALAKPAQALSVKLEPIQDLHGYDNPWPAGGEKNKLQTTVASGKLNGVLYTVNSDGSVKLGGTATANTYIVVGSVALDAGTYTVNGISDSTTNTVYVQITDESMLQQLAYTANGDKNFTLSEAQTVVYRIVVMNGVSPTDTIYPMIRLSSVADSTFAPYSNICPIYGHTDADVTRTGRNLLDTKNYAPTATTSSGITIVQNQDGSFKVSGKATGTVNLWLRGAWGGTDPVLKLYAGKTYFIKDCMLFKGTTQIGPTVYMGQTGTYTPSADIEATGVRASTPNGTTLDTTIYPYVTDSADTEWQEFGTTYPISLGTTVYGGTLDVLTGVLTVTMALFSKKFSELNDSAGNVPVGYVIKSSGTLSPQGDYSNRTNTLCNIASYNDSSNAKNVFRMTSSGNYLYFTLPTDLNSDTVITACYPLATPQTIQLTPQQVELLQGENNLWSDGTMTLVYLADGNASDVEALNILLGGRYVNNHEADEPTDREALDILLGGTR